MLLGVHIEKNSELRPRVFATGMPVVRNWDYVDCVTISANLILGFGIRDAEMPKGQMNQNLGIFSLAILKRRNVFFKKKNI